MLLVNSENKQHIFMLLLIFDNAVGLSAYCIAYVSILKLVPHPANLI